MMHAITSTSQFASATPTTTDDNASVSSSRSSSSSSSSRSSSSSSRSSTLSVDANDDGVTRVKSAEEDKQYEEMKRLAKNGDQKAKEWVKSQKKENKQKPKKKNDPKKNAEEKNKDAGDKRRKGKKHSPAASLSPSKLEAKLKQLFPSLSVEQIVSVLTKHSNQAAPALEELLDSRLEEIRQTTKAHELAATTCPSQQPEEQGSRFIDFEPLSVDQLKAAEVENSFPSELEDVTTQPRSLLAGIPTPYDDDVSVPSPNGRRKALLIGIDYLGTDKRLRGCIEDTKQIRKLLTSMYGFPDNDYSITALTDDNPNSSFHPTKRNILMAFQWLLDGAVPGSLLFFHYSGHGSQQANHLGTEKDGLDETIMPCDFMASGSITDNEIHNLLVARLKKGVKLVCFMDCCHSGSAMDLPFIWNVERSNWDVEVRPRFGTGDVQLLSGCIDEQTSAEFFLSEQDCGGAMTKALRHSLALNPFGHTYGSLVQSISKFLSSWGFRQTPSLSSTRKLTPDQPFALNPVALHTKSAEALGYKADTQHPLERPLGHRPLTLSPLAPKTDVFRSSATPMRERDRDGV